MKTPTCTPVPQLREILDHWLITHGYGEDIYWRTPEQWRASGETTCDDARLHIVMEESPLRSLLNFAWAGWDGCDPDCEADYRAWCALLESHGYFCVLGFAWSAHIYAIIDAL